MPSQKTQHDGIIFDLDGTLWDSTAACAQGWNEALRALRMNERVITAGDIEKIMGMPLEECFATTFPETDPELRLKIAKECFAKEIEVIKRTGAAIYPGVRKGLETLSAQYSLFIVSNCHPEYLKTFFQYSGLRSLFQDSECHGNTGLAKGQNIRLVVERNKLKKPCYIGDTSSDQEAARIAGVSFYHVAFGFGSPVKPCPQFQNFSELTKHFVGDE
jgi:phosphoglycolate phosphatase